MTIKARKIFLMTGIFISVISACLGLETQHNNHLGWALLFAGTAFSASGAITLGILFLQDTAKGLPRDRSLWLPIFSVLAMSLVTPLEYLYLPPTLARNDHLQDIGMILFAGGLSFYLLALGTQAEKPAQKPKLPPTPTGRRLRILHWASRPGFASLILLALGLSIGYSSLIGLLMVVFLVLPGLVLWMRSKDHHGM